MIVVDCSYALALVLPDESRPASVAAVLESRLLAPPIWPTEVANVLRTGVRRGRLDDAQGAEVCSRLVLFDIEIAAVPTQPIHRQYVLSQAHGLTPYDLCYLDLALQRRAALATLDQVLAQAARRAGLTVHA